MGLAYIKIFTDKCKYLEPFSMEERGELLTAMVQYSLDGAEPSFSTNARYIWPVFRDMLDQSQDSYEKKSSAGAKGGKGKQGEANESKTKQAEAETSTAKQTEANDYKNKNQDIRYIDDDDTACTREDPVPTGGVIAVRDNIATMSSGNWEELRGFMADGISDDLIAWAVDEACSHGARTWAYVRSVLNSILTNGVKTVADAKALADKRKASRQTAPAQRTGKVIHEQQYSQREYPDNSGDALDRFMAGWEGG